MYRLFSRNAIALHLRFSVKYAHPAPPHTSADNGVRKTVKLRAQINDELAKSNFVFFFIELNLICI